MQYSICVIDDEIPATGVESIRDTELLNSSNLQYLLQQEDKPWTDDVIKHLIETLLTSSNEDGTLTWDVYGYVNPAFYINTLENGTFRSDIVTFDWDYPGASSESNSESLLKEILDRTFSLVFIFSKADKKDEIAAVLAKPEFAEYKERLYYLDKTVDEVEQTTVLLQKTKELYERNFSFRFANSLRRKATQTMDKILSDMGKASLNDVKNHIAFGGGSKKDLVDFLTEKFRFILASRDIYELLDQISEPTQEITGLDESIVKKIWSYRLYFQRETGDDLVRCGDIVKAENNFYLVLSADCDLGHFWKKNLGVINMVTLHELEPTNSTLRDWLTVCVKPAKIPGSISSLLGRVGELADGPFVLPFVPVNNSLKNFLVLPKDLVTKRITVYPGNWADLGEKDKAKQAMKYSYWPGTERFCIVSEPFLTPIVKHVLNTIAGNGVPDYSDPMITILKKILEEFSITIDQATPPSSKKK
jgi:hypothetical protein